MSSDVYSILFTLPADALSFTLPTWFDSHPPAAIYDGMGAPDRVYAQSDGNELAQFLDALFTAFGTTSLDVLMTSPRVPAVAQARASGAEGYLVAALLPHEIARAESEIGAILGHGDAVDAALSVSGSAGLIEEALRMTEEEASCNVTTDPYWFLDQVRATMARARRRGHAFVHVRAV